LLPNDIEFERLFFAGSGNGDVHARAGNSSQLGNYFFDGKPCGRSTVDVSDHVSHA
jgi:hypothetical protein